MAQSPMLPPLPGNPDDLLQHKQKDKEEQNNDGKKVY